MFFGLGNKNPHPAWGGNYKKLWIAENKNPHPAWGGNYKKLWIAENKNPHQKWWGLKIIRGCFLT
jgi:hypothetical protein